MSAPESLDVSLCLHRTVVPHSAALRTNAEAAAHFAGAPYLCLTALEGTVAVEQQPGTTAAATPPPPGGSQKDHGFRLTLVHLPEERPSAVLSGIKSSFSFRYAASGGAASATAKKLRIARRDHVEGRWGGGAEGAADQPFLPDLAAHDSVRQAGEDGGREAKRRRTETAWCDVWLISPAAGTAVLQDYSPQRPAALPASLHTAGVPEGARAVVLPGPTPAASEVYYTLPGSPLPPGPLICSLLATLRCAPQAVAFAAHFTAAPAKGGQAQQQQQQQKAPQAPSRTPLEALMAELAEAADVEGGEGVKPTAPQPGAQQEVARDVQEGDVSWARAGGGGGGGGGSDGVALSVGFFDAGALSDARLDAFRDLKSKKCGFADPPSGAPPAAGHTPPLVYAEGGSTLQVVMQNKRGALRLRQILLKPSLFAHHREALLGFARAARGTPHTPEVLLAEKAALLKLLDYKTGGGATQVATVEKPESIWARHCAAAGIAAEGGRPIRRIVALDGLGNAENVGAVIRSAVCFGADAVLLSKSCCSPWGRRAVRVSMGHVFSVPVYHCGVDSVSDVGGPSSLEEAVTYFRTKESFRTYAAVVQDETAFMHQVSLLPGGMEANKWLLVVGAEHDGVSQAVRSACETRLTIKMSPGVDSLNVSIAAAVLLHYFSTTLG